MYLIKNCNIILWVMCIDRILKYLLESFDVESKPYRNLLVWVSDMRMSYNEWLFHSIPSVLIIWMSQVMCIMGKLRKNFFLLLFFHPQVKHFVVGLGADCKSSKGEIKWSFSNVPTACSCDKTGNPEVCPVQTPPTPQLPLPLLLLWRKEVGWACWEPLFLLFSHRLIFINVCTESSKAPGPHLEFALRPFLLLPCSLPGSGAYCLHTSVLSLSISFSKMLSFPPVLLRNNWHVSPV